VSASLDSYGHRRDPVAAALSTQLEAVARRLLSRAEELAGRQAAALRGTCPSYDPSNSKVPDASLIPSALRNVDRVVRTLGDGRPPTSKEVQEAWVARERTEQGLPADEMLDAYRLAHRVLRDAFIEEAASQHLDTSVVVQGTCLLWETVDAGASQLYAVRREMELELARYDEEQRVAFLRRLLAGAATASELRDRGAAYGLVMDRPYVAVRARPTGGTSAEAVKRAIETTGRCYSLTPLVAVVDGDVVGVAPQRPEVETLDATVGVSVPSLLEALEPAFRHASRMLEVAVRFGRSGTFGLDDLSLRVAVASEPELGALLVARYLEPLDAEGDFGALLEDTVRHFLANGQRIPETARRLGIHPNTLRYRLDRFEKLSGASLSGPLALAEIWWALECRALERQVTENTADHGG
jgi:PucR-like helix-turn-helix protein/diguanylate cyclase with GGDEF domain